MMNFIAENWLALVALAVSILAVWMSWRIPKRERTLNLLADSHRRVEEAANSAVARSIWELTGGPPPTHDQHEGDSEAAVFRSYVEGRRIYARIRRHLPSDTQLRLDELASSADVAKRSTEVESWATKLSSQAHFLDELEKALDQAAHPGIRLSLSLFGDPPSKTT